jgi:hypothetical protein
MSSLLAFLRSAVKNAKDTLINSYPNESCPQFDDTRIKNCAHKLLLYRIRKYFKAFTTGGFEGIKNLKENSAN